MKVYNHKLFPTLVRQYDDFLTKQQCEDIVKYVKSDEKIHEYTSHAAIKGGLGGVSSHHKIENKDKNDEIQQIEENVPSCSFISVSLQDAIHQYTTESGYTHCKLTQSWINIQKEGSSLGAHTHPFSQVSGVLYLKCDDESNKLYFYNPNQMIDSVELDKDRFTEYSYELYYFKPQVGTLILFPSWLKHGSYGDTNKSEERIALSFNTLID